VDVVAVMERAVWVDLAAADVPAVRSLLGDLTRIESWAAARRVAARRRLDDLARSGTAVLADAELANAGNSSSRDVAKVAGRDGALALVPTMEGALVAGDVTAGHVDVLANGFRQLEPADRQALAVADGARLARLAQRQSPDEFAKNVKRAVADHQSDGGIGQLESRSERRSCAGGTTRSPACCSCAASSTPNQRSSSPDDSAGWSRNCSTTRIPTPAPTTRPCVKTICKHSRSSHYTIDETKRPGGGGGVAVIVVVDEETLRFGIHTNTILDGGDPDTGLPVSADEIIRFDLGIGAEDKLMLEQIAGMMPLDQTSLVSVQADRCRWSGGAGRRCC